MNAQPVAKTTTPRFMPIVNAPAKRLLQLGMPMGFNGLITIRGRSSGLPRTTPVAIIEVDGRRWIWCPWGERHWVRNLRAAGRATIEVRRQTESVTARELDPAERLVFFREVLRPLARSMRGGMWFIRTFDGVDLDEPVAAAANRPVFELRPAD